MEHSCDEIKENGKSYVRHISDLIAYRKRKKDQADVETKIIEPGTNGNKRNIKNPKEVENP